MTKLGATAGGLAAATAALILLTCWYWRRTRPVGRPVMVASAGSIGPGASRRTERLEPAHVGAPEPNTAARLDPRPAQGRPSSIIDRRTPVPTNTDRDTGARTGGGRGGEATNAIPRWTGEVKVTAGPLVTGALVPLATAPSNVAAPIGGSAGATSRRWTGDRWSDCETKDLDAVPVTAGQPIG